MYKTFGIYQKIAEVQWFSHFICLTKSNANKYILYHPA